MMVSKGKFEHRLTGILQKISNKRSRPRSIKRHFTSHTCPLSSRLLMRQLLEKLPTISFPQLDLPPSRQKQNTESDYRLQYRRTMHYVSCRCGFQGILFGCARD